MRSRKTRAVRVVIYARGTATQINEQLKLCTGHCARRRYVIVSVAPDHDDETGAWIDAQGLRRAGRVDRIIVATSGVVPRLEIEVAGAGETPAPVSGRGSRVVRRIRPVKRDGEA